MMAVVVTAADDKKSVTIKITGRFDFSIHNEFRKAYKDISLQHGEYRVDLEGADYLDSSALGMLLLLKEHAESDSSKVKIVNANDEVREILIIASFDKLFSLE